MKQIKPVNYNIHIEPNLENFKFSGNVDILINALEPVGSVSLNILDLAVWNCKVQIDSGFVDCSFSVNPVKEEIKISLPGEITGRFTLRIDYVGEINDRMAGFYRSRYISGGKEKFIAVTQFEESDARRAFPCFDHPVKKATFDLEMVIDKGLTAISNCPVKKEQRIDNGKKIVKFLQTPRMSTYLFFFCVGEFNFLDDAGEVLVRAATLPGMLKYAGFGLEFGRKSLEFCEEYYGIKYPLPKLDLISIPDFAFGAMENWGAITFRENLLLHYPGITSKAGEERICEVIAHEIVHQWFGNLVTPSDWKYLWLNESFATYFGFGIVDKYYPEWDIWEQFLYTQTGAALNRDALHETIPIEIPGGEHVVINSSTAPIIYNKGGSILRQVKAYIGDENFKQGLKNYLQKHEYDCASSRHLWESFEEVSKKSVTGMMKSWIEQKGFPLVDVNREGDRLILSQKRFTYLPNESNQEWLVPVTIRLFLNDGRTESVSTLMEGKYASVDIGNDALAYKVNDGQTGFYRVSYKECKDLQKLGELVSDKRLSPVDRWGLQDDLYALVKKGAASIDNYLDFISFYKTEDAFLSLISIADNLWHAYLVMDGATREKAALTGKLLFENVLSHIGCVPDPNEKHTISILRDHIILSAVEFGSEDVRDFALDKFESMMHGKTVHQDIMKSVMQVGALNGDRTVFDWFENRLDLSESEHERINILAALGHFKDMELIEKSQQYVLEKVPDRNKFVPIVSMSANPYAFPTLWDWYKSQVNELEQFHPLHYERVIGAVIPVCGLGKEDEVRDFFQDYMGRKEIAKDVIKLSLEKMEINSRMRKAGRIT